MAKKRGPIERAPFQAKNVHEILNGQKVFTTELDFVRRFISDQLAIAYGMPSSVARTVETAHKCRTIMLRNVRSP